jgi:hypothetical protein
VEVLHPAYRLLGAGPIFLIALNGFLLPANVSQFPLRAGAGVARSAHPVLPPMRFFIF